jgi:signal peptidase II
VTAAWRTGKPDGPLSPLGAAVVVLTVIVDQAAKFAAIAALPPRQPIELIPGLLTLFRVENTGIAFSFLAGGGLALAALTVVIALVVAWFWVRAEEGGRLVTLGFALILGGAVGNLIDRLRLGSVVDFLYLHLGDRPLFVFNLADAALTLGPILLIAVYLWPGKE